MTDNPKDRLFFRPLFVGWCIVLTTPILTNFLLQFLLDIPYVSQFLALFSPMTYFSSIITISMIPSFLILALIRGKHCLRSVFFFSLSIPVYVPILLFEFFSIQCAVFERCHLL